MSVVVTGATGQLGRPAVEALLGRGVDPQSSPPRCAAPKPWPPLEQRGVTVRAASYDDEASMREVLTGARSLLLVPGSGVGQRARRHRNAVEAAKAVGVGLVECTSMVKADTPTLLLAEEHRTTERLPAESRLTHVPLRNSWYVEDSTAQLPVHLEHGIAGAARDGR